MTQGLRPLESDDLSGALESVILPQLAELLLSHGAGHCIRVTDLDVDLMVRLCGRLQAEVPDVEVVILAGGRNAKTPADLSVSSTKLVELRNPFPGGQQRPPLMVFIPSDVRAAAEDSFGVATFEQAQIGDVYGALKDQLLNELPLPLRGAVQESLRLLMGGDRPWMFADPVAIVRFLLTAKVNGNDAEAIGAALYELALVPDFELLAQPERAPGRVARNRECVEKLTWSAKSERGRVLDLGLADRDFKAKLGSFAAETGLEDPRTWTRRIVRDHRCWGLAFHEWTFEDSGDEPDSVCVSDVTTGLPMIPDGESDQRLSQLIGQHVLSLGRTGPRKFNVSFRVDPLPGRIPGLAKFSVQVISREHGPVGLTRSKAAWSTSRPDTTVSFTNLNKVDWEEGWHFIRVLPQSDSGDLLPLVDTNGTPVPWTSGDGDFAPRPNESDLFYVLPDGEVDVELPQRARQREQSLVHARTRLQFAAVIDDRDPDAVSVTSVRWAERKLGARAVGTEMLEVAFGREGTVDVPVSRTLKDLEQRILTDPMGPISWRIPISLGHRGQVASEADLWPEGEAVDRFLAARSAYFEAVRSQNELVTQAVDPRACRDLIFAYAESYRALVGELLHRAEGATAHGAQRVLSDLRKVLAIDTVALAVRDYRDRRREAALVSPTHPLRALWLAVWSELTDMWLQRAKSAPREFAVPARDALLRLLTPISFPPVLPMSNGRVLTAVDNLHPLWTMYAPPHEEDPRGLVGEVCEALGLPEPAAVGTSINGAFLASRVQRYLVQHPYVRTLTINAFNPGRGAALADMLVELQRHTAFTDIRYDIRLFAPDADSLGLGEALNELLSPGSSVTAREADAFSTPTDSHLRPKLRLAVLPISEFKVSAEAYPAHLSLLFDVFPASEVGVSRATIKESMAPIHGLVQDFQIEYHDDDSAVAWTRQPRHGAAFPVPGAEELTDLLSALPSLLSSATATVSTGEASLALRPTITLALDTDDRSLLHQVHEASDWVLTVDRNMGIEFFDHGGWSDRPDYLIDHTPGASGGLNRNLTITSRSVAELEAILLPVLKQYHLTADGRHAVAILDQLRSLSGRLALKLISSATQRSEALGLALCRMYLEYQGVFSNQIVVPLDAHLDLYRTLRQNADEIGDEVSFKRTDLALFDLDARARTITCRLIEVKCYNQVGDLGAYKELRNSIAEQIAQSQEVISYHFDPHRATVDRPDRLVKSRELTTLLEFYLDRAIRYRSMNQDAAEEARFFLRTLEGGYRLNFARAALIFDFDKPGTEAPDFESGIEYHRIGVDLIQQLVGAVAAETVVPERTGVEDGGSAKAAHDDTQISRLRERAPAVPTLDEAAFLGRPRDRSVSWEELASKRTLGEDQADPHKATADLTEEEDEGPIEPPASPPDQAEAPGVEGEDNAAVDTAPPEPERDELPVALAEPSSSEPAYDVLLGVSGESPQYGVLGEVLARKVAIDLNQTHTTSLFGVQGGGKSYTLGTIVEMASLPIPHINRLPHPLATVIFHYSQTMDYQPEFTSMVAPNSDADQIAALRGRYGAEPRALTDVLLLVPRDKLEERRAEYPGIEIRSLTFAASELQASHWRFLMGAVGNQATYMRQVNRVMKQLRNNLTLDNLRAGVDAAPLPDHLKELAHGRLDLAAEYIDDSGRLGALIHPGRLVIVDLRDEFIEKDQALGLFVVLLQLFADATDNGKPFNKLVVFDEAHKYIESPDLVAGLVEVVREMRHKGTSIMVASQDPPSVPVSLIELSSQIILHKFNSPAWLKHIQKANAALTGLTADKMAQLRPGEAYVWSSKATDDAFTTGAIKVKCRPRVTQHGGDTKTAVLDDRGIARKAIPSIGVVLLSSSSGSGAM